MRDQQDNLFSQFLAEESPDTPYTDAQALMDDLLRLVGMLCMVYIEICQDADIPYELRGMIVQKAHVQDTLFARSAKPIPVEVLPEIVQVTQHIQTRVQASQWQGVPLPFVSLVRRFSLSEFEAFCLLLAVCPDLDRRFEGIFSFLQDDVKCTRVTLGLAWDLFALLQDVPQETVYAMLDRQRLINELLLTDWQNDADRSVLTRPLAVPKQLLYLLTGVQLAGIDDIGKSVRVMRGEYAPILWNQDKIDDGSDFIEYALNHANGTQTGILYLFGPSGNGKSFALFQMVRRLQLSVLEVDADALVGQQEDFLLRRIAIQCLLDGHIPCLDRLTLDNPEMYTLVQRAVRMLRSYFPLVILCADKPWAFARNLESEYRAIEFPMPDGKQRYAHWEYFGCQSGITISETELAALAGCYRLSTAEIISLCTALARDSTLREGELSIRRQIADILREQARGQLGSLAQYVVSPFGWEDLQLPEDASGMLRSACARIQCRYQVNDNWGFARKLPYGQGISILMYGPPGTGKSMAAQVLAREVGIDLFRVDLSQIVDKYIGETEKNLGRLFDTAEGINCILFFDEADALFSKRTEVGDSKDKYANVETSYLLQRMEQFPGITILATNNARNFDEAFRRRMTYFINIPMPDQQTRLRIWETVFPKELPIDRGVNFEELAQKFEFSGSSIKSVAVSAAYAAAAAGTSVTRRSIYQALQIEYLKTGKLLHISEYPC